MRPDTYEAEEQAERDAYERYREIAEDHAESRAVDDWRGAND